MPQNCVAEKFALHTPTESPTPNPAHRTLDKSALFNDDKRSGIDTDDVFPMSEAVNGALSR